MVAIQETPELKERAEKVRALLDTLNDYLPGPTTIELGAAPGASASKYHPCTHCKRTGRIKNGNLCVVCFGEGWRTRRPSEVEWDRYLEMPVHEAMEYTATTNYKTTKRHIPAQSDEESFAWERAKKTYYKHGSYKELESAYWKLHKLYPENAWVIRHKYMRGMPLTTQREIMLEEMGIIWLAANMRTVRVPPWLMENTDRKTTIEDLAAQGHGPGYIAKRLKMSKRKVRKILKKIRGNNDGGNEN